MSQPPDPPPLYPTLLAVDLGLRAGLALYGNDGRLRWYRSHNFGNMTRLKRGVYTILNELPTLHWLVLEGGGPLALIWRKEAENSGALCSSRPANSAVGWPPNKVRIHWPAPSSIGPVPIVLLRCAMMQRKRS